MGNTSWVINAGQRKVTDSLSFKLAEEVPRFLIPVAGVSKRDVVKPLSHKMPLNYNTSNFVT